MRTCLVSTKNKKQKHQIDDLKSHLRNLKTVVTRVFSTLLTISWPRVVGYVSIELVLVHNKLKYVLSTMNKSATFKKRKKI